eukprot:scaffold94864_cov69-Phaeocystis_antarctica.AAC.6
MCFCHVVIVAPSKASCSKQHASLSLYIVRREPLLARSRRSRVRVYVVFTKSTTPVFGVYGDGWKPGGLYGDLGTSHVSLSSTASPFGAGTKVCQPTDESIIESPANTSRKCCKGTSGRTTHASSSRSSTACEPVTKRSST